MNAPALRIRSICRKACPCHHSVAAAAGCNAWHLWSNRHGWSGPGFINLRAAITISEQTARLWAALVVMVLLGCDPAPRQNAIATAELAVQATCSPLDLDAEAINGLLTASRNDTREGIGNIYQVHGQVANTEQRRHSTGSGEELTVRLTMRHPDYIAVEITCYFAQEHEGAVRAISPGDAITLRGTLDAYSGQSNWLRLIGCVLVEAIE